MIQNKGSIAEAAIRNVRKNNSRKIIDIKELKLSRDLILAMEEEEKTFDYTDTDVLHTLYIKTQHKISQFIELFAETKESRKLTKIAMYSEDLYMPSGPPISPVTRSLYFCWLAFDVVVGIKKESYISVLIELCKEFKADPEYVELLEIMRDSRMGLYFYYKSDNSFTYLRELFTNKIVKVFVASSYKGVPGELWLTRILTPPKNSLIDYALVFTNPYIILDITKNRFFPYKEADWLEFIERNIVDLKGDQNSRYYNFMKYGKYQYYWNEYVTLAYVNHTKEMIWLTGFPDRNKTLPHAKLRKNYYPDE